MAEQKTKKTTASIIVVILAVLLVGAACQKKADTNTNSANAQYSKYRLDTDAMNINVGDEPSNTNASVNGNAATGQNTNSSTPLNDSVSTLANPVKVMAADNVHYFIVGQPQGQNTKTPKKIIFSLPGHGTDAATDYNAWKGQITDNDYAVASLNWWDGEGEDPQDYLTPIQVLSTVKSFLGQYGYDANDFVVLEGFSRGSANTYAVMSYDMIASQRTFDAVISASGKYESDFNMAPGALASTTKLYLNVPWILACGAKDDNPERSGCEGMGETKTWLESEGANIIGFLQDPNGGHGAFHSSPLKLVDQALALLDQQL